MIVEVIATCTITFPLFDNLNDDFGDMFVKADADVRCIVWKAESVSFQTGLRHFFGALGRLYPGEWRQI